MPTTGSTSASAQPRLRHGVIAALGLVTICCYGAWYYAFGVLFDPLLTDTGWRESAVTAGFSAGIGLIGVSAVLGGRLLDRVGPRVVFALAAVLGGGGLVTASLARNVVLFDVGAAIGGGALGSLAFYHVTMTSVVRTHPGRSDKAIAVLTIWGAFASPIYLPLTDWMVGPLGWRVTLRVLAATAVVALVIGIVAVPGGERPDHRRAPRFAEVVSRSFAAGRARRFAVAVACIGLSVSVILAYQVPVMVAAGLAPTAAAAAAGLRGFSQLGGRLPLGWLVARIGSGRALLASFGAIAVGSAVLALAGHFWIAVVFALVVGFGIGSFSPLQGMYSAQLFDTATLGATMGLYSSIGQLAGAVGPFAAGLVAESTGDRRWVVPIATLSALLALAAMSGALKATDAVASAEGAGEGHG